MTSSRSFLFLAAAVVVALGAAGLSGAINSPAQAGDGCCGAGKDAAAKPAASMQPVAMTAQGGEGKGECPYAKAAAARADGSSCSTKGAGKVPAAVQSAMLSFQQANKSLNDAVNAGAGEREIRALAVKAGGSYAELARVAAATYRESGSGPKLAANSGAADSGARPGFAAWISSVSGGQCPIGACAKDAAGCASKEKSAAPAMLRAEAAN